MMADTGAEANAGEEIENAVRRLVVEHFAYATKPSDLGLEALRLDPDADFENDLGFDLESMEDLRFIHLLERHFEIAIPQDEGARVLKNVRQTCEYIRELRYVQGAIGFSKPEVNRVGERSE